MLPPHDRSPRPLARLAPLVRWLRRQPLSARLVGAAAVAAFAAAGLIACQGTGVTRLPTLGRDAGVPYEEPDIRVRIARAIEAAEVTGPEKVIVRRGLIQRDLTLDTPIRVEMGADGLLLTPARGAPVSIGAGSGVTLETPTPAVPLALNGTKYPGSLTFHPRSEVSVRAFDAVATMMMEEYLPGVLAKELYANWPLATYQAQAVASRSYAIHERARARLAKQSFDVESTTLDQAFIGTTTNERARMGVFSTRGVVLLDQGRVLRAYYSSTSGGRSASADGVWPSSNGLEFNRALPLQGTGAIRHACEDAPLYRWTRTRSLDDLNRRLVLWASGKGHPMRGMSGVRAIAPGSLNAAGRPNTYIVTDDQGRTFRVLADDLRVAMNTPAPGLPDVTRETMIASNDFEVTVVGKNATIRGRGFGHGVGLCQYSAKKMAERGEDWRSIVTNFYPGAQVRRVY